MRLLRLPLSPEPQESAVRAVTQGDGPLEYFECLKQKWSCILHLGHTSGVQNQLCLTEAGMMVSIARKQKIREMEGGDVHYSAAGATERGCCGLTVGRL